MKTAIDYIRDFYGGRYYPILVALLIFLGHATGYEVVFGILMALSVVPACLLCRDIRFAILPFLCSVFLVSAKTYAPNDTGYAERYLKASVLIPVAITAVLVVGALIFFMVRNRKTINQLPPKGMFWGMVILCGAFFCNGLFSDNYTVRNLLYVLAVAFSLLAVYALFSAYLVFDEKIFDHFMYCVALSGLLICAELICAYFTTVQFVDGEIVKGSVVLGWGVWTTIGGMLAFLLPAHFYFAASHKHGWLGYLTGFLQYFCVLLSQSRGALLVGTLILGLCLLYLLLWGENRKQNRIITTGIAVLGIVACVVLSEKMLSLIHHFLEYGFDDNGRFDLWSAGIAHFLENPVFGSGFYDSYINEAWEMDLFPYLYHNTVVQLLGATGIVGTLAYAYHRFCTVRLVFRRPNVKKTFLGICILGLLVFSLTDVLLFKVYSTIFYSMMLLFMDKSQEISQI